MSKKINKEVLLLVLITIVGIIMASQSGTPQKNTLSGGLTLDQGNNQLLGTDESNLARLLIQANSSGFNMKVSQDGADVRTADDVDLVFNSDRNLFKIIDRFDVTVASVTTTAGNSNGTSATIDLSSYDQSVVILPIARKASYPSFIWQGTQGVSTAVASGGIAGWQVLNDYSTTFTGLGTMQLTRTLINASGSSVTDPAYNVTVYVLQETIQ